MKITPTSENVSWDHAGYITVDGLTVAKVDDDRQVYVDGVSGIDGECDIDDLKTAISELISESDDDDFVNENVAAWAGSR